MYVKLIPSEELKLKKKKTKKQGCSHRSTLPPDSDYFPHPRKPLQLNRWDGNCSGATRTQELWPKRKRSQPPPCNIQVPRAWGQQLCSPPGVWFHFAFTHQQLRSSFLRSQGTGSQQRSLRCCHPTNPRSRKQAWHLAAFYQLDFPSSGYVEDGRHKPDASSPVRTVQMCTTAGTSRAPETGLTVRGFAAPAATEAKHCFHYSHFSWPLSPTTYCFLNVLKSLRGAQTYPAKGMQLCSSRLPWLFSTGMSPPWDILAEQDVL